MLYPLLFNPILKDKIWGGSKLKDVLNKYDFLKLNDFQKKNLAMAVAAAKISKLSEKKIFNSLKKILLK